MKVQFKYHGNFSGSSLCKISNSRNKFMEKNASKDAGQEDQDLHIKAFKRCFLVSSGNFYYA